MKKKWILLLLITISSTSLTAQDALYPNTFPLGDVRITAGPFKHACDLNVKVLLQYDTDRLLPLSCVKQDYLRKRKRMVTGKKTVLTGISVGTI